MQFCIATAKLHEIQACFDNLAVCGGQKLKFWPCGTAILVMRGVNGD